MGSIFGKGKKKQIGNDGIKMKEDVAFPVFKFLMIGDLGVGKSSVLLRYTDDSFTDTFIGTIGVDYKDKEINLPSGAKIRAQIWDTAGQERFRTITSSYYRSAHGMILTFDMSQPETFKSVEKWLTEVQRYGEDTVVVILAGNKSDIASPDLSDQEIEEWCNGRNLTFMKLSAKDGTGVDQLFQKLGQQVVDSFSH